MNSSTVLVLTLVVSLGRVGCARGASEELELAPFLASGMVVQRDTRVMVAGRAMPNATVEIAASWLPRPVVGRASQDGGFLFWVTTLEAGGPHTLSIAAEGAPPRVLEDVWLGEVWLASGQSNMEWSVAAARFDDLDGAAYAAAVAAAANPMVRFFEVPNVVAAEPRSTCGGTWRTATADALHDFSAVGFHFASRLQRELGVPVGIVQSDWGGTVCEAWTSEAALRTLGGFDADLARLAAERDGTSGETPLAERRAQWWRALEAEDVGFRERWFAADLDASGWEETQVPGDPDAGFDGCFWLRRSFEVPAAWAGRDLELSLGPIDDMDVVWFEGERIGALQSWDAWNTPRTYTVPGSLVKGGRASVCVLAVDPMGGAGLHGDARTIFVRPLGDASDGVASIALDGTWRLRRGSDIGSLGAFPSGGWLGPNTPTALYNAMIAPLATARFRGAIWYQGESNAGRPEQYAALLPAMIADWRRLLRPDGAFHMTPPPFPFGIVQIAPWGLPGDTTGQWARLRMAQNALLPGVSGVPEGMHRAALEDVGVVSIMDAGDAQDIHPRRKKVVGERLADWALCEVYAATLPATDPRRHDFERRVHRSPEPRALVRTDVAPAAFGEAFAAGLPASTKTVPALSLELTCFGHVDLREALTTSDGAAPTCFEVASADGVFHPAVAVLVDVPAIERSPGQPALPPIRRAVLLHSGAVRDPQHVRFAWGAADQPNLRTTTGLAVGPFVMSLPAR
jgi:sialate O-acetylesterase